MISCIILAAGASSRMGGVNKQLAKIGDTPVFVMSALKFERSEKIDEIIIAAPNDELERYEKLARNFGVTKLKAVVAGGETRALSVKNALTKISPRADIIAIHDGARPLIDTEDIDRVLADAERYDCAIAATPSPDTIKVVGSNGFIEETVPRKKTYCAQTPQAFRRELYLECLEKIGSRAADLTDDSSIMELCGKYVRITEISGCNMKITRPEDLAMANAVFMNKKTVKMI